MKSVNLNILNGFLISFSLYGVLLSIMRLVATFPHDSFSYLAYRNTILGALVILMNSLFVFYFIAHRPPIQNDKQAEGVSISWAFLGTYLPLFFNFTNFKQLPAVDLLIFFSILWAIFSVIHLGKSSDILVSNRGIVMKGTYKLLRHPLYASYLFTNLLYFIISPFYLWRMLLFSFWVICIYMRIHYEEQFLSQSKEYEAYKTQVRYRLIPFLW